MTYIILRVIINDHGYNYISNNPKHKIALGSLMKQAYEARIWAALLPH